MSRKIGIFIVSFWLCFHLLPRQFELQFHGVRLKNQLDFKRLKQIGINKIIFRAFQDRVAAGGLYFRNSVFKFLEPILDEMIDGFDFNRVDLWAWMISRKFKWIHNDRFFDYEFQKGKRKQVRKLDVFNPKAVEKIIAVYCQLAKKRINGILIQDDLILRYNEGFSNWGKAAFEKTTNIPAEEEMMMQRDTPYNSNWIRIKMNQVNKVLALIIKNCKRVNPDVKIGMNIYYETPLDVKKSEAWYGHNLREIVGTGIDFVYLMAYHRQMKEELRLSEGENRVLFNKMVDRAYDICREKLVVKLQIRDWTTKNRISHRELIDYIKMIPAGVKRICFTPAKPNDMEFLENIIQKVRSLAIQ